MGSWRLNELGKKSLLNLFAILAILHGALSFRNGNEPLKLFFSNVIHYANGFLSENATLIFLLSGLVSVIVVIDGWKKKTLSLGVGLIGVIVSSLFLIRSGHICIF